MDERTRQEIDKAVARTLRDAGLKDPPFRIEDLLQHMEVHRGFYDLEDPSLLHRRRKHLGAEQNGAQEVYADLERAGGIGRPPSVRYKNCGHRTLRYVAGSSRCLGAAPRGGAIVSVSALSRPDPIRGPRRRGGGQLQDLFRACPPRSRAAVWPAARETREARAPGRDGRQRR